MKTIKGISLHLMQFMILLFFTASASAQLKADFGATPSSGCPPMVVKFQDSSAGNPTSWKWDLGNGTISYLQNPIATYFTSGSYTVKLVVKTASGADSIVKSQFITVSELPKPAFGASDTTGCFPLKVSFSDSSLAGSGTITSWQWDFGDGTLSNEKNPVHTYTNSGNFTVILRIFNSKGCSQVITKPGYITIQNGVKAGFTYSSVQACTTPQSITFTNTTVGTGLLTFNWNFGDGHTSVNANPVNNYVSTGSYTVKLVATNSFGCSDTLIMPKSINIGIVKADFSVPDAICAGSTVRFTNTSNPTSFISTNWFFSDTTSADVNVSKVFTLPGVYPVKLVTNFGSCRDSVLKSITVLDKPSAGFTAANTKACNGPLDVSFTNTSVNATQYSWDFGDNSTSAIRNPVHTYTKAGSYAVRLIVTNAAGCTDTIITKNLVRIFPPTISSIKKLKVKGCIPLEITPEAIIQDSLPGSQYLWDFGDGSTSTLAKPSHIYTTTGVFNVKLTITSPSGCIDTLTVVEAVKAGVKPEIQFVGTPTETCAFNPVTFTDLSANVPIHEWSWNFGDGGTSIVQNPVHAYGSIGKFNVTLVAFNFGCSDTLTKVKYINILPPIANFDTSFLCNVPMTRNFIDKSVGANTWNWDFGDGNASTQQNSSHTYAVTGKYKVKLTVSNGSCSHTREKDVVIVKEHGDLQISDLVACLNTPLSFNAANINAGNVALYSWYFDSLTKASIDAATNPIVWTFTSPGQHTIALVLTDILNCKDTTYAITPLNIYGPRSDFASILPNTCFGNTIRFDDSSKTDGIHPITEWSWNYGEGIPQTYTAGPFSHDYAAPGDYNIKLKVKDSYGCVDSITKPAYVSITKPVAKFTPSDSALCPAVPVTFTNKSIGVGATYSWDFGDGNTSKEVSPSHKFAGVGEFKVKMLMKDKNGCLDSTSTVIKIFTAHADFELSDSFSTCPPLTVNITNKSANYISVNWNFSEGGNSQLINPSHMYTYPGTYLVKLTVTNNGGCTDELTKKITIQGPTGKFLYTPTEICNPGTVSYKLVSDNAVKYIWDYNDGTTIISTSKTSTHTYTQPGIYVPKIVIEDAEGCPVPIRGLDTIKVYDVQTYITSTNKLLCDSGSVSFKDSTISNDAIGRYMWNFGDGATSSASNPTHYYKKTGLYTVKLVTTTRFGCVDSTVVDKYIKIVNSPLIKMTGDLLECEPANLKFSSEFVRTDTSAVTWNWNFGNGNTATVAQPDSQTYETAGTYPIEVRAINSDGCSETISATVVIHPKPVVDAGVDTTICLFSPYALHATGADTYTWTSNSTLSCTTCASPDIRPKDLTTYYVKGKTVFGCEARDSVTVKVNQPFKMNVGKADTVCLGSAVTLKASGADKYVWTPSLWLNNPNSATPVSRPDTTITYQVIGSDNNGCFKDTGNVSVKVYPIPDVEITNGENITLQVGSSVKLVTKSSSDVTALQWSPGQSLSCVTCAEPVAAPKNNITYAVTATNQGKCISRDQITINVICGNANIFMPNTFSPNGDGSNDVFFPRGTGLYNIRSLKIFNRWGECIFDKKDISANNAADGWNGSSKGVPLPTDVYVYFLEVICDNSVVFPIKGNVTLLR